MEIKYLYSDGGTIRPNNGGTSSQFVKGDGSLDSTAYVSLEYVQQHFIRKPDVLYETDGTTGLLGINNNSLSTNWQLENMDFTPYKYLKCYFKNSDYEQTSNYLTSALVIILPLDDASKSLAVNGTMTSGKVPCDMYLAGGGTTNPNDLNVLYNILVAVDSTKTKFQVVSQTSLYGTAKGNRNNDGRYLYKIEGWYD